jgi:hypothetical protein
MSLKVGDKAPDFTLPTNGGGKVALKALKGKKVAGERRDGPPFRRMSACNKVPDATKLVGERNA